MGRDVDEWDVMGRGDVGQREVGWGKVTWGEGEERRAPLKKMKKKNIHSLIHTHTAIKLPGNEEKM